MTSRSLLVTTNVGEVDVQIRRKLRSLEGLLQFTGNEQHISHTAHKLSIGAFALQTALDKVRHSAACWVGI